MATVVAAPSDGGTGLRARKKLRTRRQLERTALELFTERGFDAVTIDEIVAAADVSKRTFYRYFETKEDVLFGDYDRLLDQIAAAFARRSGRDELVSSVKQAVANLARSYEVDRELVLARGRIMARTPSVAARSRDRQAEWEDSLAVLVGRALGVDPDLDVRPRLIGASVIAAFRVATQLWLAHDGVESLTDLVDEAFELLDAGLAAL
jgi:AcrR family transcriptional regulator